MTGVQGRVCETPAEGCYPLLGMKAADDHLWLDARPRPDDECIRCGYTRREVIERNQP